MATKNQVVERIKQQTRHTQGMIAPWLHNIVVNQKSSGLTPGLILPAGIKFRRAARKMRAINPENLQNIHPKNHIKLGQNITKKASGFQKLIYVDPKVTRDKSVWPELNRVYPNQSVIENNAPFEAGVLKQGSIIPKMNMFPTSGQSLTSFKEQMQSSNLPKPAPRAVEKRNEPAPNARLYTRVQEFSQREQQQADASTEAEPNSNSETPPPSAGHSQTPAVQRETELDKSEPSSKVQASTPVPPVSRVESRTTNIPQELVSLPEKALSSERVSPNLPVLPVVPEAIQKESFPEAVLKTQGQDSQIEKSVPPPPHLLNETPSLPKLQQTGIPNIPVEKASGEDSFPQPPREKDIPSVINTLDMPLVLAKPVKSVKPRLLEGKPTQTPTHFKTAQDINKPEKLLKARAVMPSRPKSALKKSVTTPGMVQRTPEEFDRPPLESLPTFPVERSQPAEFKAETQEEGSQKQIGSAPIPPEGEVPSQLHRQTLPQQAKQAAPSQPVERAEMPLQKKIQKWNKAVRLIKPPRVEDIKPSSPLRLSTRLRGQSLLTQKHQPDQDPFFHSQSTHQNSPSPFDGFPRFTLTKQAQDFAPNSLNQVLGNRGLRPRFIQ